ncbi:hypothetical protein C8J56DRAFT_1169819 [Mycena floridula]|nr:hypothetical protein C8J56DRAFT_1169819 [Mycena floridula]
MTSNNLFPVLPNFLERATLSRHGFTPVPTEGLVATFQDLPNLYITAFVNSNDPNPGKTGPIYEPDRKQSLRNVAAIPDIFNEAQTDFFNSVDVLAEFGRFG